MWTKETLENYRVLKGWKPMKEGELKQTLAIINDINAQFSHMTSLVYVEPEIIFHVRHKKLERGT